MTLLQEIFDTLLFKKEVNSQVDFANKIGYTEGYVSAALKKVDIPSKMQRKLHEIFSIDKTWLLSNGKEGEMFTQDEPRISTEGEDNTSKKLSDNGQEALNSSFTKNEQDMYNRYMALLEHKERNMEKLINNNEKFANGLLMLINKFGLKEENIDYPKQKQA